MINSITEHVRRINCLRFVHEEVGFGSSVQQVSRYANGCGTTIIKQFTGHGYKQNIADAMVYLDSIHSARERINSLYTAVCAARLEHSRLAHEMGRLQLPRHERPAIIQAYHDRLAVLRSMLRDSIVEITVILQTTPCLSNEAEAGA